MLMAMSDETKNLRQIRSAMSPEMFAELSAKALEISARLDGRNAMRNAEVYPDVTPHWHVVTVLPGQERTAAEDLSDRCFGVYLPEMERIEVRRGRKREVMRLLLPGYVFVFVWNIDMHLGRLRACDGVRGLLLMNGRALIVPDKEIDRIRARENAERPLKGLILSDGEPAKKQKRCWRKTRKVDKWVEEAQKDYIIATHSYSPFMDELRAAGSDPQISAFHKALGLALHVPPESA